MCGGCNSTFSGRSVPEYCAECQKYYHKHKCLSTKKHKCIAKNRLDSSNALLLAEADTSGSGASIVTQQASYPMDVGSTGSHLGHVAADPETVTLEPSSQVNTPLVGLPNYSNHSQVNRVSPDPSSMHLHEPSSLQIGVGIETPSQQPQNSPSLEYIDTLTTPALISPNLHQSAMPSTHSQHNPLRYQANLNPNAQPFLSATQSNTGKDASKAKKRQAKHPAATNEEVIAEYLKVEINMIQTKLKQLEIANKDLEFRNSILLERNKILEQNNNSG